jgi:hypothetical protein
MMANDNNFKRTGGITVGTINRAGVVILVVYFLILQKQRKRNQLNNPLDPFIITFNFSLIFTNHSLFIINHSSDRNRQKHDA